MENIRSSVFETNSSSSHSVSINISTKGMYDTLMPDAMGDITFNGGDFSKPEYFIQSTKEKANAVAVYCALTGDEKVRKMFEEVVLKQTGAEKIVTNIRVQGPELNSYMSSEFISHLTEALGSKKDIKDFVFNHSSHIEAVFGYDG